jgi:hypothetical protein
LKKPLALWLQHFLSDDPKPVTVAFLHKHSGGTARSLRHFREQLRLALTELVRVGAIQSWTIDAEDIVRTASAPNADAAALAAEQDLSRTTHPPSLTEIEGRRRCGERQNHIRPAAELRGD